MRIFEEENLPKQLLAKTQVYAKPKVRYMG